jgi:two-component system NtrC family response regulator
MTDGNYSAAAKLLGITRPTLYDLVKKYDINIPGE